MLIIKKASRETRKLGWSFDWDMLIKIQDDIERLSGDRLQLEEIDSLLSYLEENLVIKTYTRKEKTQP